MDLSRRFSSAKIALSKIHSLEKSTGVEMHPMIGVGSMPFRGHLSPTNVEGFLDEYRGLSTVTVQSAFRYDYPLAKVREAISLLNSRLPNRKPWMIGAGDEKLLRTAMYKLISAYQSRIEGLAPFINSIAEFVPRRRARKLHIGLFGYSRNVKGKAMPRAIPFAAAFYSIGIPPEFIGASAAGDPQPGGVGGPGGNLREPEEGLQVGRASGIVADDKHAHGDASPRGQDRRPRDRELPGLPGKPDVGPLGRRGALLCEARPEEQREQEA